MQKESWKTYLKSAIHDIGIDAVGGLSIGIGIYNFAVKAEFPMAGVSGIALIIYRLFHFPIGLSVILMNVPIAIICYRMLGKRFFINSIRSLIITSIMIDGVAPLFPVYEGERMLAAICAGLFSGLGYAMIFMNGSSTGGMDFVTMSIRAKRPHLSIGRIIFILDCTVVFLGGFILGNVDALIYGLLITYILTKMIDKIVYGVDKGKMALIVTGDGKKIADMIEEYIKRGSTILAGRGSFTGENRDVVMCACSNRQMYVIRKMVKSADNQAFIVIMESSEVVGEGFKKE